MIIHKRKMSKIADKTGKGTKMKKRLPAIHPGEVLLKDQSNHPGEKIDHRRYGFAVGPVFWNQRRCLAPSSSPA